MKIIEKIHVPYSFWTNFNQKLEMNPGKQTIEKKSYGLLMTPSDGSLAAYLNTGEGIIISSNELTHHTQKYELVFHTGGALIEHHNKVALAAAFELLSEEIELIQGIHISPTYQSGSKPISRILVIESLRQKKMPIPNQREALLKSSLDKIEFSVFYPSDAPMFRTPEYTTLIQHVNMKDIT